MDVPHVGREASLDGIVEILSRDGCIVIEHLAGDLVGQAVRELGRHIEESPFGPGNFHGEHAKNIEGLVGKSEAANRLMIHETILGLADRLLLPNCVRYQINYTGIMHLEPGTKAQELHRDGDIYPFRHPSPTTIMATMWAGTEFTAANGGTLLVPGSHLWEDGRRAEACEVVAAQMPAGSVLIYLGGLIHAGGANTSANNRTGIAVQYSLGWLRQEENLHLAVPPELARILPDRLARLVGYEFGGPFCGFVHGDDPHRLIEDRPLSERRHSTPELDEAAGRINRWHWGKIEPEAKQEPAP